MTEEAEDDREAEGAPGLVILRKPSPSVILRKQSDRRIYFNIEILPLHFVQGQDDREEP